MVENGAVKECLLTVENHIVVIGFGNQARAWCANLRDSGFTVSVWLRENSPKRTEVSKHFPLFTPGKSTPPLHFAWLIPDDQIAAALAQFAPQIPAGSLMLYAHGWALVEDQLAEKFPQFDHALLAPKAIGTEVRNAFLEKRRLGGVYSLEFIAAKDKDLRRRELLALANGLGITWGPFEVTARQELTADLFSEQAVLCSVIPESARLAFGLLVDRGIPAELAYLELWHEVGLIVKAMTELGPAGFFQLISPNALIGSEKGRALLCDEAFTHKLQQLLADIESGRFKTEVRETQLPELRAEIQARWTDDPLTRAHHRMTKAAP